VLGARGTGVRGRAALEELCSIYWPPLYSYARRTGNSPEAAADAVQGYLARLLARGDLEKVEPDRGRFRSYLLAGIRHYLVSEARREHAAKRGGEHLTFSLDATEMERSVAQELTENLTPEVAFDRRWAQMVIDRAIGRLATEHSTRGRIEHFEILKPTLAGDESAGYATLGKRLGLSEGAVGVAIHRMRSRLRELVRAEVAQTVGTESDLEEELRHLLGVWSE
jgi:RNA polymerase sigma-70 factor (ECF subfamily)